MPRNDTLLKAFRKNPIKLQVERDFCQDVDNNGKEEYARAKCYSCPNHRSFQAFSEYNGWECQRCHQMREHNVEGIKELPESYCICSKCKQKVPPLHWYYYHGTCKECRREEVIFLRRRKNPEAHSFCYKCKKLCRLPKYGFCKDCFKNDDIKDIVETYKEYLESHFQEEEESESEEEEKDEPAPEEEEKDEPAPEEEETEEPAPEEEEKEEPVSEEEEKDEPAPEEEEVIDLTDDDIPIIGRRRHRVIVESDEDEPEHKRPRFNHLM